MILRDLPLELARQFGDSKLVMGNFANPSYQPTLGTDFIQPNGRPTPVASDFRDQNADTLEIWEPLGGPFFRLPLAGLVWEANNHRPMTRIPSHKRLFAVGLNKDVFVFSNVMFSLNVSWSELKSFGEQHKIMWLGSGVDYPHAPYCVFYNFEEYTQFLRQEILPSKYGTFVGQDGKLQTFLKDR